MLAKVSGASMSPGLNQGDLVLIWRTHKVKRNQVVIAQRPGNAKMLIIKRVLSETITGYWLQGDNKDYSDDSRIFGEVNKNLIVGKVLFKYWRLFTN